MQKDQTLFYKNKSCSCFLKYRNVFACANMLVARRNVKFALEAFCVAVKTGCLFQVYWPGQERWIWHAWEKVKNRGQLESARTDVAIHAVFYCGRKCKNTPAQTGESRTKFCNSCFSYCGPKVQKCVKVLELEMNI